MSDAALWVHCSLCMTMGESSSGLLITSCGRVICKGCRPQLVKSVCDSCSGPCNNILPLSRKAPSKVLKLFKNDSEQLKEAFKNVSWQQKQKQSILEHKKANIERLENEEKEHDMELERLEKELVGMREQMQCLENEEKELLKIEKENVFNEEFGIKAARLNHIERGANSFSESRSAMVERQRIRTGSYKNSSLKQHPVKNTHAFAGGDMVRIGVNPLGLDEDLERKSPASFSNERVDILSKQPRMTLQSGGGSRLTDSKRSNEKFMGGESFNKARTPGASVLAVRTSVMQPRTATVGSGPVCITPYHNKSKVTRNEDVRSWDK